MIGKLGNSHLEPRLDSRHDLLIALGRDERDGKTLGPETASTSKTICQTKSIHINIGEVLPDTMQVAIRIRRTIVVDDDVHSFNVNTTTENVCRYENSLLESLECRVTGDTE